MQIVREGRGRCAAKVVGDAANRQVHLGKAIRFRLTFLTVDLHGLRVSAVSLNEF